MGHSSVGSRECFWKVGDIIACLYVGKNDPGEIKMVMKDRDGVSVGEAG